MCDVDTFDVIVLSPSGGQVNHTVYVDSVYGNNATGLLESPGNPFLTIAGISFAAPNNTGVWHIVLRPGEYVLPTSFPVEVVITGAGEALTTLTSTSFTGAFPLTLENLHFTSDEVLSSPLLGANQIVSLSSPVQFFRTRITAPLNVNALNRVLITESFIVLEGENVVGLNANVVTVPSDFFDLPILVRDTTLELSLGATLAVGVAFAQCRFDTTVADITNATGFAACSFINSSFREYLTPPGEEGAGFVNCVFQNVVSRRIAGRAGEASAVEGGTIFKNSIVRSMAVDILQAGHGLEGVGTEDGGAGGSVFRDCLVTGIDSLILSSGRGGNSDNENPGTGGAVFENCTKVEMVHVDQELVIASGGVGILEEANVQGAGGALVRCTERGTSVTDLTVDQLTVVETDSILFESVHHELSTINTQFDVIELHTDSEIASVTTDGSSGVLTMADLGAQEIVAEIQEYGEEFEGEHNYVSVTYEAPDADSLKKNHLKKPSRKSFRHFKKDKQTGKRFRVQQNVGDWLSVVNTVIKVFDVFVRGFREFFPEPTVSAPRRRIRRRVSSNNVHKSPLRKVGIPGEKISNIFSLRNGVGNENVLASSFNNVSFDAITSPRTLNIFDVGGNAALSLSATQGNALASVNNSVFNNNASPRLRGAHVYDGATFNSTSLVMNNTTTDPAHVTKTLNAVRAKLIKTLSSHVPAQSKVGRLTAGCPWTPLKKAPLEPVELVAHKRFIRTLTRTKIHPLPYKVGLPAAMNYYVAVEINNGTSTNVNIEVSNSEAFGDMACCDAYGEAYCSMAGPKLSGNTFLPTGADDKQSALFRGTDSDVLVQNASVTVLDVGDTGSVADARESALVTLQQSAFTDLVGGASAHVGYGDGTGDVDVTGTSFYDYGLVGDTFEDTDAEMTLTRTDQAAITHSGSGALTVSTNVVGA